LCFLLVCALLISMVSRTPEKTPYEAGAAKEFIDSNRSVAGKDRTMQILFRGTVVFIETFEFQKIGYGSAYSLESYDRATRRISPSAITPRKQPESQFDIC
jgi:hypothetical protein